MGDGKLFSPEVIMLYLSCCHHHQGYVDPDVVPGTVATVFSVYDNHQKLQYIGFSKDLRASLRTVLGRRPDKAVFFKWVLLTCPCFLVG